jgi:hypothetical protein
MFMGEDAARVVAGVFFGSRVKAPACPVICRQGEPLQPTSAYQSNSTRYKMKHLENGAQRQTLEPTRIDTQPLLQHRESLV